MANIGSSIKKKDFQKMSQNIQDFQLQILSDVDATRLRDALNMTLLQMQTYWKILKKKQDKRPELKYSWPWYDLKNPQNNAPQYLSSSLHGSGVQKDKLPFLFDVLSSGDIEKCEEYVESQGYKGETDVLGRTPLHYCAGITKLQNHTKYFIKHGCDLNHQAHDGSTALHRAVLNQNSHATRDLLQCNADTAHRDMEGRTAAHWATLASDVTCLEMLITHGADINIPDNERHTPIMWSVMTGNVTSLKLLLASPLGPKLARTTGDKGQTLLHMAVNHPEVVVLLLNTETVVQKDKYDRNILHHAAMSGRLDVCRVLADSVALTAIMQPDSDGKTPLHLAVNNGHSSVANFLLEKGGDVHSKDIQGLSPLETSRLKQLHYCNVVLAAYNQEDDDFQAPSPPKPRPSSSRGQRHALPTDSHDSHPNDRRVVIRNTCVTKTTSKSTPALRLQNQANLSSITPGLLRHSTQQLQNVSQKVSRLREIPAENRDTGLRDQITGGVEREHQRAMFPTRPSSSRGNKGIRPPSPVPPGLRDLGDSNTIINNDENEPRNPAPWKLNDLKPKPPPKSRDQEVLQNGDVAHNEIESDGPSRPRTARGNHSEGVPSQRYGKVDPILHRKGDGVLIGDDTMETVHSLHDAKHKGPLMRPLSPRHSSLLGTMPALPGQPAAVTQTSLVQPWYKTKLQPVLHNKMDILKSDEPPNI